MPAYTFRCRVCGEVFTRRYGFHDDLSAVTCPQGHREVERVFVPPAVVFKGSGFYETDYRSENYKAGAKKESESKKSSTKSDSKSKTDKPKSTKGKSKPPPSK
jgi:putative FmdB family regulatory protein